MPAQGVEHLEQLIVGLDNLAVVKGHDATDMVRHRNGKCKRTMKSHSLRDNRAREIGVVDHIVDPFRLAALQNTADKVDAWKKNRLAARLLEFVDFISR